MRTAVIRPMPALYEVLNAAYDLDQAHLTAAALPEVPPAEAPWHAHHLRRRLTGRYRASG